MLQDDLEVDDDDDSRQPSQSNSSQFRELMSTLPVPDVPVAMSDSAASSLAADASSSTSIADSSQDTTFSDTNTDMSCGSHSYMTDLGTSSTVTGASSARSNASCTITSATAAGSSAESTVTGANSARSNANCTITSATAAGSSAESTVTGANSARSNASCTITSATAAGSSAESTVTGANSARSNASCTVISATAAGSSAESSASSSGYDSNNGFAIAAISKLSAQAQRNGLLSWFHEGADSCSSVNDSDEDSDVDVIRWECWSPQQTAIKPRVSPASPSAVASKRKKVKGISYSDDDEAGDVGVKYSVKRRCCTKTRSSGAAAAAAASSAAADDDDEADNDAAVANPVRKVSDVLNSNKQHTETAVDEWKGQFIIQFFLTAVTSNYGSMVEMLDFQLQNVS